MMRIERLPTPRRRTERVPVVGSVVAFAAGVGAVATTGARPALAVLLYAVALTIGAVLRGADSRDRGARADR